MDTATKAPPWTIPEILHLFHHLAKLKQPGAPLLAVAHRCFRRSLYLTRLSTPYAPAMALLCTPRGLQYTSNAELRLWHTNEIHTIGDIYEEDALISFAALAAEMGLPTGQFLLYNSLIATLKRHCGNITVERQHTYYYSICTS
ncbi:hypothetical protein NDU88_001142 [Pleurodeles waltl]|uniref:Uncharacterized protein n=1 Tax=Pleurodeles waltl TaxID=8319 RepID=A0AAV7VVK9_PLEWA|nr:hypothetical protein NDU88_001142 [Pleurodeles waltl]